jgi:hypothetical protein
MEKTISTISKVVTILYLTGIMIMYFTFDRQPTNFDVLAIILGYLNAFKLEK